MSRHPSTIVVMPESVTLAIARLNDEAKCPPDLEEDAQTLVKDLNNCLDALEEALEEAKDLTETVRHLRSVIATFPPKDKARPMAVHQAEKWLESHPEWSEP